MLTRGASGNPAEERSALHSTLARLRAALGSAAPHPPLLVSPPIANSLPPSPPPESATSPRTTLLRWGGRNMYLRNPCRCRRRYTANAARVLISIKSSGFPSKWSPTTTLSLDANDSKQEI
ncbi:unnamed protein product [Urochloa humidicola]